MKNTLKTNLVVLALSALTSTALSQNQVRYEVEDLGAINGESEAYGINNNGKVVGWSFLNNGQRGAMLWQNGQMVVLNNDNGVNSVANDINDNDQIVGRRGTRGVQFTGIGQYKDLGTLGGPESTAYAIDDWGRVAGGAQLPGGSWRAALAASSNNPFANLGTLPGNYSIAKDANGGVVGWSHTASGPAVACIFGNPSFPNSIQSLGTLGGPQSEAHGINTYYGVTGWADLAIKHNTFSNFGNVRRAFRWTPETGKMTNLGTPWSSKQIFTDPTNGKKYFWLQLREGEQVSNVKVYGVDTYGFGINKYGVVCGYARLYVGPVLRQVIRAIVFINGKMHDLNDLVGFEGTEWALKNAWAINDGHTIVGRGFNYATGQHRAFIARRVQ